MASIDEMTPEQLRSALREASEPRRPGYTRRVESHGKSYELDLRRVNSLEFLRKVRAVQEAPDGDVGATLDMVTYGLGPVFDEVVRDVTERVGYDDYAEIMSVCNDLIEAAGAKN